MSDVEHLFLCLLAILQVDSLPAEPQEKPTFSQPLYIFYYPQVALVVKNPLANAGDIGDVGLIPGPGIFPGEGHDNALQYSCPENPHGTGSSVHGFAKSWTRLKRRSTHGMLLAE